MSLDEAKASSKRVREAGKTLSNRSILSEVRDRQIFPKTKKSKKERYQEEQKAITAKPSEQVESELEETNVSPSSSETPQVEVFDYETLQEDFGF